MDTVDKYYVAKNFLLNYFSDYHHDKTIEDIVSEAIVENKGSYIEDVINNLEDLVIDGNINQLDIINKTTCFRMNSNKEAITWLKHLTLLLKKISK